MSSFPSVTRSMHSANAAVASKLRLSSCFFPPALFTNSRQLLIQSRFYGTAAESISVSTDKFRSNFVDALVKAGRCKHRRPKPRCVKTLQPTRRQSTLTEKAFDHDGRDDNGLAPPAQTSVYTRQDYLALVDYYRETTLEDGSTEHDPREDQSIGAERTEVDARERHDSRDSESTSIKRLQEVLNDNRFTVEEVFEAYGRLPKPGVRFLDRSQRASLVRRLSILENKNSVRTLQYFSVLDDYKLAGLKIPRHAYNSAIHLGGRTQLRVADVDVEVALRTWKEMETEAGVEGDATTFNILFDSAAKAGKFGLAEMILEEMRARGVPRDRYTKVGLIFYHGLRKDGQSVRKVYRDFVESGEIVDTTVLNCMMNSLIKAGEPEAAESVFKRMKALSIEKEGRIYSPKSWSKKRELGKILRWIVENGNLSQEAKRDVQAAASLSPDILTCNILLGHFCQNGELQHTVVMLDEAQRLGLTPDNRTFRELMEGFALSGGVRFSSWTGSRLESVWRSYKALLAVKPDELYLTKYMVVQTLRAFRKCCGKPRELEIREELQGLWKDGKTPFEDILASIPPDRAYPRANIFRQL